MTGEQAGGWSSYIRPLVRQSRFKMFSTLSTVKEWAGSNASIAAVTGSVQNLLDPTKMMNLQEDARTHKISSEVLKQSLCKSFEGRQSRPRMSGSRTWSNQDGSADWQPRYYQSMPPTPLQSVGPTPSHSPTRKFSFRFLSRGTTPRANSPCRSVIVEEDEDESCRGLASILKPRPRIIRANQSYTPNDLGLGDLSEGLAT